MGGRIIKIASIALALLTLLFTAVFGAISTQYPPNASASGVSVIKDLPDGAPKQGIIVDRHNFYNIRPIFTPSNNNIKMIEQSWYLNEGYTFAYNGVSPASGSIGDFTLRWNHIGTDLDGDDIDIIMRVSNIHGYGLKNPCFLTIWGNGTIEGIAKSWDTPYTSTGRGYGHVSFDVEYFMYKSESSSPGTLIPANGNWVISYVDLDQGGGYDGLEESIRLLANFGPAIHIIPDDIKLPNRGHDIAGCWLTMKDLSTQPWIGATAGRLDDGSTLHTGFCAEAMNGYKFRWNGHDCGTILNSFYGTAQITATHDNGGTISDEGITEVAWKNDKTYTITPARGYKVKDVLVDGKSVGAVTEYTFTEVITDHIIHATFEPCQVNLFYDKNAEDATGDMPSSQHDAYSTSPADESLYTREGHGFIGWNTQPDGSGTSILPGAEIAFEDKDITLYAQWEKIQFTITWIDEMTGETFSTETVPWGEDASTVESFPTHTGYSPDPSAITQDMLLNVREDREIRVPYVKNKYALDVKFLNKHYRTEIQDAIHDNIEYESSYSISSYISDIYIFELDLTEIRDADTGELLDVHSLIEIDDYGQVTLKSMPAQNIEITLLYDTWIEMPETGNVNGLLVGFIGVFFMITGLILIALRKK